MSSTVVYYYVSPFLFSCYLVLFDYKYCYCFSFAFLHFFFSFLYFFLPFPFHWRLHYLLLFVVSVCYLNFIHGFLSHCSFFLILYNLASIKMNNRPFPRSRGIFLFNGNPLGLVVTGVLSFSSRAQ